MVDIKTYNTQELVLTVNNNYDPTKLDLNPWCDFINVLCGDREYQKNAIRSSIIYLASREYSMIEDLVKLNWHSNSKLRERYRDMSEYLKKLQLPRILSGVIDLATGTGKSYVIYGIAQIALGLGLVDKTLVLCPSLTIESGLKEKFENLSSSDRIKATLPEKAVLKNPRIIDANRTIKNGDIVIENIHAVYGRTGSSIEDSLKGNDGRTLVLNDEVHHVYNVPTNKYIKKWKEFILNPEYRFKYVLGFTGTAYINDEYFNDVIYRYPIRQAINDGVIKSVDYVCKDYNIDKNEKFQKIYDNHVKCRKKYHQIKPLTILITKDIAAAKRLREELIDFLVEQETLKYSDIEKKILIVTSHKDHKKNIIQLKSIDDQDNHIEWIVSVSMLTEGWDVKNVFQIVPWEDRAFNSKLLIAQVLGRGLRIPEKYKSPQPKVRVFNHDSWSRNIRGLVDEILEIEKRVVSISLNSGERTKYHFDIYNIDYEKEERLVPANSDTEIFDYTNNHIKLASQSPCIFRETEYEDVQGRINTKYTVVRKNTYKIDEVVHKIIDTFRIRDFEAKIRFPHGTYDKENLPPISEIKKIVLSSMSEVGIKDNVLTEDNVLRVYKAFQTLFRKRSSTAIFERKIKTPYIISTKDLERDSLAIGNVHRGSTIFYADTFEKEIRNKQADILKEIINDESLPRSASMEVNHYCLKTPVSVVITNQEPERKFVETIVNPPVSNKIDAWIKSRDRSFYSIEYSWRRGGHAAQNNFNPDFFLKFSNNIIVVEIKSDYDNSDENKAKYRWAKEHFEKLNIELEKNKIKQRYFFHFLSPINYSEFTKYLLDGRLFKGEFRSALESELI